VQGNIRNSERGQGSCNGCEQGTCRCTKAKFAIEQKKGKKDGRCGADLECDDGATQNADKQDCKELDFKEAGADGEGRKEEDPNIGTGGK